MAKLFERVVDGLKDAAEHAAGRDVIGMSLHVPENLDVGAIRRRAKLSQPAFAETIGVSLGTLRGWEQKRRHPDGPARVLLAMLSRNPRIVAETLGQAKAG